MAITLRSEKGSPLTHTELDQNFKELFYSSSISGSTVTLHKYNSSGSTIPVLSLPTTGSVQEIDSRLDGKIDIVKEEILSEINTLENVINSANINQELTATATGVDTVALPKTAANTGMQVQMFGQSATQLVANGNFANGLTGWTTNSQITILDGVVECSTTNAILFIQAISTTNTSKYYVRVLRNSNGGNGTIGLQTAAFTQSSNTILIGTTSGWSYLSGILTATDNGAHLGFVRSGSTGSFFVKSVQLINLTATFGAGNEPTKEQCDVLFANYFEGSDNVLGTGRVRSVGKNLLPLLDSWGPITSLGINFLKTSNSEFKIKTGGGIYSPYIRIKAGNVFTFSSTQSALTRKYFFFYDNNFNQISSSNTELSSTTLTAATVDGYIRIYFLPLTTQTDFVTVTNWQLERNSTATTYEPFRQSILQLTTPELRSNGIIKDEIRKGTNGYELVRRVGVGTLGSEKLTNGNFNNGATNWGTFGGALITDRVIFNGATWQGINQTIAAPVSNTFFAYQYEVITTGNGTLKIYAGDQNARDTNKSVGQHKAIIKGGSSNLLLTLGGQYFSGEVDNISVKQITPLDGEPAYDNNSYYTDLGNGQILYTLATPTITPIAHAGLLNSNSNGTAYFEPIIADAGVYASNLAVQLTDHPIASFESIRKYANGTYTELNTATAVIAGDGLSFTHPDLVSGDLVMFTYAYANESIGRSMTFTYPISNSNPYYNVTNSVPLTTGYYTSTTARAAVPEGVRKTGLILTYETAAGAWYTERYIGTATDTTSWTTASNWEVGVLRIASVTDITEYAEITI